MSRLYWHCCMTFCLSFNRTMFKNFVFAMLIHVLWLSVHDQGSMIKGLTICLGLLFTMSDIQTYKFMHVMQFYSIWFVGVRYCTISSSQFAQKAVIAIPQVLFTHIWPARPGTTSLWLLLHLVLGVGAFYSTCQAHHLHLNGSGGARHKGATSCATAPLLQATSYSIKKASKGRALGGLVYPHCQAQDPNCSRPSKAC